MSGSPTRAPWARIVSAREGGGSAASSRARLVWPAPHPTERVAGGPPPRSMAPPRRPQHTSWAILSSSSRTIDGRAVTKASTSGDASVRALLTTTAETSGWGNVVVAGHDGGRGRSQRVAGCGAVGEGPGRTGEWWPSDTGPAWGAGG